MLHIILLDCAIELMPKSLCALKPIQQHAHKKNKKPTEILLDQSYHGGMMLRLPDSERRGRPDITYLCFMTLLETPLCKAGLLKVHLHLQDGRIVNVNPEVRLPRNYDRFVGLMEQLLIQGQVPPEGKPLLHIDDKDLQALLSEISGDRTDALTLLASEDGERLNSEHLFEKFPADSSVPVVIGVGAFPHGNLDSSITTLFSAHIALDVEVMMAWHVCGEALWAYSFKHDVAETRYNSVK